ncbi:MAG: 4-alpha-glucanotransferase, partial [Longimicrobiales bacterium]|nr:4-alpha-glucanotransferase [Longimicrobiales bacterium]
MNRGMDGPEASALQELARELGVLTGYRDGLGRRVEVPPEGLVALCSAVGPEIRSPADAAEALGYVSRLRQSRMLSEVIVAWDGRLDAAALRAPSSSVSGEPPGRRLHAGTDVRLTFVREDGEERQLLGGPRGEPGSRLEASSGRGEGSERPEQLPFGYHRLRLETAGRSEECTVISAPRRAWRPRGGTASWGLAVHLSALRSSRSRSVGDLRDLEAFCRWTGARGGDVAAVLPLLPTFNRPPSEPSPYSPVSRLFWSELILDLGDAHRPTPPSPGLDVERADAEVRAALDARPSPDAARVDEELRAYARFRGAQARLGRDWRRWPRGARRGTPRDEDVDPGEERFHLIAQVEARRQLGELGSRLASDGFRIGLDLAVGVHPDGFDPWSRQGLFASGISVGAPPDRAFPSGQSWGFPPVLPEASRAEGHRYLADGVAHQAAVADVLRVDHVMALTRLFWIPAGGGIEEGSYVRYPAEELFAVLCLESHRHHCEIVGENLGTVPDEVEEALHRHGIAGMYLAQFDAAREDPHPPRATEVSSFGTHDTATFAGWLKGRDIDERLGHGLVDEATAEDERTARRREVERLME